MGRIKQIEVMVVKQVKVLLIDPYEKTVRRNTVEVLNEQYDEAIKKILRYTPQSIRLTDDVSLADDGDALRGSWLYFEQYGAAPRFRLGSNVYAGFALVVAHDELLGGLCDTKLTAQFLLSKIYAWIKPSIPWSAPIDKRWLTTQQVEAARTRGRANSLEARSVVKKLALKYARRIDRINPFDRTAIAVHAMLSTHHSDIDVTAENVRQHLRNLEAEGLLQPKPKKPRKPRSAYRR